MITKQGSDQIAIQLPGVRDPEAAAKVIGKTAQLEFYDLEADLVPPSIDINKNPIAKTSIYALLSGQQALVKPVVGGVVRLRRQEAAAGRAGADEEAALGRRRCARSAASCRRAGSCSASRRRPCVVSCGVADGFCPGVGQPARDALLLPAQVRPAGRPRDDRHRPQALRHPPGLRHLTRRQRRADRAALVHGPRPQEVRGDHTRRGAARQAADEHGRAGADEIFQHFAIVLDREIKSWPRSTGRSTRTASPASGGAQISGSFSVKEAKDLALVLQTGALPVKFVTLDQTAISATLGKDSLKEAKRAALVGLLIVALFLIVFYRFLGIVAVLGLGVYAAFLYAAILLFNVTLTLPGFAGLVLTLGVAADANVVIFERVKEESRAGHSMRARDRAGLRAGFHTIVDANVVTAITAFVLFAVATASREGLRADAPDRYGDLDADRGRLHARAAVGAGRLLAGSRTRR